MALEIRVLGGVDAIDDGRPLRLGGRKQRAVLAMLALRANRTVGADALIDGLWGDRPPQSAGKNVQHYISQLRKALASNGSGAAIVTRGRGYELKLPDEAVDAVRFEHLVERARRGAKRGIADGAAKGALELWQGAPLADVAEEPFAGPEIRRLEELHLRALELMIDAELAVGQHAEVIGSLEALIAEHPTHERFHAQRMLALYRAGRQSEAVEGYRAAHRTLSEQIGSGPGPQLHRLQEQILAQDPALEARPPPRELPPQLEGGSPLLAGRERELRWLQKRWREAETGRSGAAVVRGPAGIGKTRLAAELAADVQPTGAAVLYAGSGAPDAALEAIRGAEEGELPTLLVLDDADDGSPSLLEAAAALAAKPRDTPLLLLVLHQDEQGPPAFAAAAQRLSLRPLRVEAAAEIAELYAPADGMAMPVETLMAESEGVPLRVHRAASQWAQAQAAERLEADVGSAATGRGDLRAAEARVAGSVSDLRVARERTSLYVVAEPVDPSAAQVCPFRGLASFDSAHAEYFFGRERLVADLVARLVGSALIAVVGASGSGKSSVIRAGLLQSLADGVLPGSERWRQVLMRPGERPLAELGRALGCIASGEDEPDGDDPLAAALASLRTDERLVLVVDQFEEIFTACRDAGERAAFAQALAALAEDADQRAAVVLGIRGDFYGRCAEYPGLSAQMSANTVLVGAMRRDELRRAIELPAQRAGLRVEPRLVTALVGEVADEPGGLPLLSTTLVELWEERSGRTMRAASYEASGGVSGAVARLAERAYRRLTERERERARAILLRLVDAEEPEPVRRRVPLAELEVERDEDTAAALAVLTESRLITVDEGTVEVAHEALLREWPRLRGWLADDAEGRRLHQHLIHAAAEWEGSGRDPAELYRGARLASALDWAESHERELNELERVFLEESRVASEREAERQRRTNRRLRTLLAGVGGLLAAAVVAGGIALSQRQEANSAATTADVRRLAAQAVSEERRDQALRLATAGVALEDLPATRSSLLSALVRDSPALGVLNEGDSIYSAALSPDGRTLATDGVTFFDTQTRERIGEYRPSPGEVSWLGFDPRGGSLAVVGGRKLGYLHVLDAATQRQRTSARLGGYPADPGKPIWPTATYAPDGRSVIVQYARWSGPPADAHVFLRRFDPRTGSPIGPAVRVAARWNQPRPSPPSMTQDGRLFIAEDEVKRAATYAIDADSLRVLRRYPVGAFTTAVSPDGATLALGQTDGRVRLLDPASGRVRTLTGGRPDGRQHSSPITGYGRAIWAAAFSPDGRTLATGDGQGNVIVWDVSEGRAIETLEGHIDTITGVAFGPDGRTLYTTSADSTARIWDVAGYRRLARPFRTNAVNDAGGSSPRAFALSPDGHTLAAARRDGRVDLIDAETLRRTGGFEAFADRPALAIEYSPDGGQLAVAGGGGGVGVWDAGSGDRVGRLLSDPRGPQRDNRHDLRALAFGPGGLLAAAEVGGLAKGHGAVRIWELDEPSLIRRPLRLPQVRGLAFSPDGSRLAIAFGFRGPRGHPDPDGIEVRDVRSGETLAKLRGDEVGSVAFSPDGSLLAGGQLDGRVLFWAADGWGQVGAPLASGAEAPSVAFSPDGRTLATSDDRGAVALWDVASQQAVGPPLPGLPDARTTARFTPDGARLFAVSETGRAIRWEVDPELWLQRACALAGGSLTPEEWAELVPEQDYRPVCPSG